VLQYGLAGLLKRAFRPFEKVFQASFKALSGLFQRYFRPLSKVLQASFKGLSGLFQRGLFYEQQYATN